VKELEPIREDNQYGYVTVFVGNKAITTARVMTLRSPIGAEGKFHILYVQRLQEVMEQGSLPATVRSYVPMVAIEHDGHRLEIPVSSFTHGRIEE